MSRAGSRPRQSPRSAVAPAPLDAGATISTVSRTVREVLRDNAAHTVGRDRELALMRRVLEPGGPLVLFVYGIAGIGKSTLAEAFAHETRTRGVAVIELDGRHIEPTERGFLSALSTAIGSPIETIEQAADRIGSFGSPVVVTVDTYEVLRILDPWVRATLVPSLPDTVRLVLCGREAPMAGWASSFGQLFASVPLGNLAPDDAREVLRLAGADPAAAQRINRLARGHPLSLKLAAAAVSSAVAVTPDAVTVKAIVGELTELYLRALDPATREILDAASVVRRPTRSILAAMLPHVAAQDAFERLRDLPFVELTDEGLAIHDTVREAVAASLRSADPDRSRRYRAAAWRQLRDEVRRAAPNELWRYTADLLYMIENPIVREAFFPSGEHQFAVEAATGSDFDAIRAIGERHLTPSGVASLDAWLRTVPNAFRVVRDRLGDVVGFYSLAVLDTLSRRLIDSDPVARRWAEHVRRDPVPAGQRVLALPFALTRDHGEALCPELAVMWLDVKRVYMEMRPRLRRLYGAVADIASIGPTLAPLGFELVPGGPVDVDGVGYHLSVLDFGPASVDGWLSRLIGAELQVEDDPLLDPAQRQVRLGGRRVDLTPLEFDLMSYLYERSGKVVRRTTILDEVWGQRGEYGGSNVIEVVVRSLRKKLGDSAGMIETVRGTGYRLNATR